jgi:cytochrome c biogenesis protein ResB
LACAFGSLFPRVPDDPAAREAWPTAVELRYGRAGLLRALGLFDVYRAPWFLALLAALLLNTLVCTLQRLPSIWRSLERAPAVVQPDGFYSAPSRSVEWAVPSQQDGVSAVRKALERRRYHVGTEHSDGKAYIYAERGRWARGSTLISHSAALLLILAMAARPALSWQETGVVLLPGQTHPIGHGNDLNVRAGPLIVPRSPGGHPRDVRALLAVVAGGITQATRSVRVNHSFSVRGLAFHLQSYGPAARVQAPEGTRNLAFADDQAQEVVLPSAGLTLRVAYRPQAEGTQEAVLSVEALDADGDLLGSGVVPDGEPVEIRGTPIAFQLSSYAVWQISRDPTFVPAVTMGALLLVAAAASLWVPYRRLWLQVDVRRARMVGVCDVDVKTLAGELARAREAQEGEERDDG